MRMLTEPQLFEIARNQKRFLRLLLLSVVVVISTFWVPAGGTSRMLLLTACGLIGVIAVVSVYRLAKVIEVAWPWLYAGCAYIPYLGTLTLLVLNLEATAALKARGISLGLMGVSARSLVNLKLATRPEAAAPGGLANGVGAPVAGQARPSTS